MKQKQPVKIEGSFASPFHPENLKLVYELGLVGDDGTTSDIYSTWDRILADPVLQRLAVIKRDANARDLAFSPQMVAEVEKGVFTPEFFERGLQQIRADARVYHDLLRGLSGPDRLALRERVSGVRPIPAR